MDIYDREIERLISVDGAALYRAWMYSLVHSPLFDSCDRYRGGSCGCLSQVRAGFLDTCAESLTQAIRADDSLPKSFTDLRDAWDSLTAAERRAKLEPFARWQRRMDAEIPDREEPRQ